MVKQFPQTFNDPQSKLEVDRCADEKEGGDNGIKLSQHERLYK